MLLFHSIKSESIFRIIPGKSLLDRGVGGGDSVKSFTETHCREKTLAKILIQGLNPLLTLVAFSTHQKIKLLGIISGILFLSGDEFGRFYSQELLWYLRTGWEKFWLLQTGNPTAGFVLA